MLRSRCRLVTTHSIINRYSAVCRIKWVRHIVRMGQMRQAYKLSVGKPEGKIPVGRPRRRWEDNIIMDNEEI
jgi:hypothetical protein